MTDYGVKVSQKAKELMQEANATHAVFGVAYKSAEQPFGMNEKTAIEENQIHLFFDDITYQNYIKDTVEDYRKKSIEIYAVYAVHKEA